MQRLILDQLCLWKNSVIRKPLILNGVRQVGKTWALQEFGRLYYDNVVYVNFDHNEPLSSLFETTKDPKRIIQYLQYMTGEDIKPGQTLIIFDEIQECNKALNSLKYFCEEAPMYHVACAGSFLGIALSRPASFPVGKVDFLFMHPMTFTEFLLANGDKNLVDLLDHWDTLDPIPAVFFNPLYEKLKMYFITGGMPESVRAVTELNSISKVQQVFQTMILTYKNDFSKHINTSSIPKILMIWESIPSQLGKDNKKFIYRVVKEGARAREYEDALQWLVDARLVHKIYRSNAPRLPLSAYDDLTAFKIYLVDVGLLRSLADIPPSVFGEENKLFTEFKGAFTENFVLQGLVANFEVLPRYWSQNNPPYEVDFLLQREGDIFPIEVKAETNLASTSLKKIKAIFPEEIKLRIRFSLSNLKLDGDVLNIPLFMIDQTDRLIELALNHQHA